MTDQQIQHAILEGAYNVMKQKGSIEGAIFVLFEKTKDWGVEEKDINRNVDQLAKKRLIKKEGVKLVGSSVSPVIRITDEGADRYKREHECGDYGKYGRLADENR